MDRGREGWKVKSVVLSDYFECREIERGRDVGKLLGFCFLSCKVVELFKGL